MTQTTSTINQEHRINIGTSSDWKFATIQAAIQPALGLLGLDETSVKFFPTERFSAPELGLHEFANAEEKALAVKKDGMESFGWDIGLQIDALDGPGPHIKRVVGPNPTNTEVYHHYRDKLAQLPEEQRKGHLNYALCFIDDRGHTFFTASRLDVKFDINAPEPGPDINPLDTMMSIDLFGKTYADLDERELGLFNDRLARGLLSLVSESEAQKEYIDTRRSHTMGNKTWVFSQDKPEAPIRLCQAEDEERVNTMSSSLTEHYDGHSHGWAWKAYVALTKKGRADSNGHHSITKDLILMGPVGEAFGQFSLVGKSSDAIKINTWVVDESQRGKGYGGLLLREIVDLGEALGIRKLYATTASPGALHLFKKYGFKVEVVLPDHYKEHSDEKVLGKILIPAESGGGPATTINMLTESNKPITEVQPANRTDSNEIMTWLTNLSAWQNGVDAEYLDKTFRGVERGFDKIAEKGKYFIVAKAADGTIQGVAAATLKMGGLVKIYPLIGSVQAQEELIRAVLSEVKKYNIRILYVFSPVWDKKQAEFFTQIGLKKRGTLRSAFKQGADVYQWSERIENLFS